MPAGNSPLPFPLPIRADRPVETHAMIESVEPESIGSAVGLRPGDEIYAINGARPEDVIDYRFLIAEEEVTLTVAPGGDRDRLYTVTVEKEVDETLGVMFTADVFDGIRICNNNCDFCFVYQNPRKMRRSLYIKDDDYRLSFLHGDFVTLTNLTDVHFERIAELNLSPLYVSIHATDPEARVQMLRNPKGALLWDHLARLWENGIQIHGQVVLCPGMNDGAILERTVEEMAARYPDCLSLAIVPVGLTGFRRGLPELALVSREQAGAILDQVQGWQRRFRREIGARFVYASDEMHLLAGRPFPPASHYEAEGQYENGVGLVAHFQAEWRRAERRLPERLSRPRRVTVVTGTLAAPVLEPVVARLNRIEGLDVELLPVVNDFFGPSVTVAGLLTGQDILRRASEAARLRATRAGVARGATSPTARETGQPDALLLPDVALRGDRFLDDMTLADLARELQTEVIVVPHRASDLAAAVLV
jgi:putative radical SAM enzyme (TIGR03279 family)